MDLDKSLDAILAGKPKTVRRNGKLQQVKPASGAGVSKKQTSKKQQPAAGGKQQQKPASKLAKAAEAVIKTATKQDPTKIIVHNFPNDITQAQIREYIADKIGPVSKCELAYDQHGRSKGTATIVFKKEPAGLANKAAAMLNGLSADRKKALQIEVVHELPAPGLAERLTRVGGGPQQQQQQQAKKGSQQQQQGGRKAKQVAQPAVKATKLKKTGPGRVKRVAKTSAELDAEMTDYFEKKTA